jgi:hypothetical protein
MTDDIAKIAAGLTKAHKAHIASAEYDGQHWVIGPPWQVADELFDLGLTGQDQWSDALTPLGLAVRAYLLENTDATPEDVMNRESDA